MNPTNDNCLGNLTFYQFPKALNENPKYKKVLSNEAKLLYMYILDIYKVSKMNGWKDDSGKTYVYFSINNIMEQLNVSNKTAIKRKKELCNVGLIKEVPQGKDKPNMIYVELPEGVSENNKTDSSDKNTNEVQQESRPPWQDWD